MCHDAGERKEVVPPSPLCLLDERPDCEPDEQPDEEQQRLSVRTLLDAALVAVVGAAEDVVWHAYSSGLLGAYFSTSALRCFGYPPRMDWQRRANCSSESVTLGSAVP